MEVGLGRRLVPYQEGWDLQRAVHAQVVAGTRPSTLIALEHEDVYTMGRRTRSWERPAGDFVEPGHVPVIDVDRGGKTTWHGPGQLTVYPVVRLAHPVDVIAYVRALEAAVMEVCAAHGVGTTRVEGRSGVWVPPPAASGAPGAGGAGRGVRAGGGTDEARGRGEKKICALGVRVARGVTMHGIGLNVCPDLAVFDLDRIVPCGIRDAGVTSLAAQAGPAASSCLRAADLSAQVLTALETHLAPLVADPTPRPPGDLGLKS